MIRIPCTKRSLKFFPELDYCYPRMESPLDKNNNNPSHRERGVENHPVGVVLHNMRRLLQREKVTAKEERKATWFD
ncbi:unnamed protein product [Cuscuta campestris]|uniref:Uncharacterized protein n=1 Tax=Cuscuta campestris TaxID=132261 RepID=A0A484L685_9ASTE|nr:unnamed protein product [Cuscuta campestris]